MTDAFLDLLVVPEWREHYVPYQHLHGLIEELAAQHVPAHVDLKYRTSSLDKSAENRMPFGGGGGNRIFGGNLAASFTFRQDTNDTFAGTLTMAPGGPSPTQLNIHVATKLTAAFQLEIERVEWRLGKRGAVQSELVSGSDVYRQLLEQIEGDQVTLPLVGEAAEMVAQCTVRQVVLSLNKFNTSAMEAIRPFVENAGKFYEAKARELSAVCAACVELLKVDDALTSGQSDALRDTLRKLHHSLQRLQEFCDANFLITSRLLDDIHASSHQHLDAHDVLRGLVFANPPNTGPVFMLRQLLVSSCANVSFNGDEDAASKSLALQDDIAQSTLREPLSLGLVVGATIAVLVVCVIRYTNQKLSVIQHLGGNHTSDAYMFSTSGTIILLAVLFAVDVIIWERHRVNYVFSLHLNPLRHFKGLTLLRSNCMYALLWAVCVFCYLQAVEAELYEDDQLTAMERLVDFAKSSPMSLAPQNISFCAQWNRSASCLITPTAACCPSLDHILSRPVLEDFTSSSRRSLQSWVWPYLVYPVCIVWWFVDDAIGSEQAGPRHRQKRRHHAHPSNTNGGGSPPSSPTVHSRTTDSWLLRTLLRIAQTPFLPVEFPDFFICEQLVSLSTTVFELQFVWCFFHSSSNQLNDACDKVIGWHFFLLLILPSCLRALQSGRRYFDEPFHRHFYPHVLNGLKSMIAAVTYALYASTKTTSFLEASNASQRAVFVLFIIFSIVDSLFKCWYELWVEFGLLRPTKTTRILRHSMLYHPSVYYLTIAVTVVVRMLWLVKFFAESTTPKSSSGWIYPVFATLELLRRFLWNCVRVENDQVSNTESYKLVKLAPTVHVGASSVALWDVTLNQLLEQMEGIDECRVAAHLVATNYRLFFRGLSAAERVALLTTVLEATPIVGVAVAEDSPSHQRTAPAAAAAPEVTPRGGEPYPVMSPERSASKRATMFFRDPRSGLQKTSVRLFDELHSEDRCRAVLLRVGAKRTLLGYLSELVASKDLESDVYAKVLKPVECVEQVPSSPFGSPQRSASFLRRMGTADPESRRETQL